ncbi:MAG: peptidylprolyl isomerase [Patiriisocius sp.]|uniref:peptidylprolyl isomerase n=1 Tax=Patiriisocius sp. TaxID=2822396 RepID=UPI003EF315C9
MSYSLKILASVVAILFLFINCEDKKKTPTPATQNSKEASSTSEIDNNKTRVVQDTFPKKTKKETPQREEITNENVVEFLTNYGKENPETKAKITTRLGEIEVALFESTPLHRANFIYLAKEGYYNTTFFHRVVPGFIIQAGTSDNYSTQKMRTKLGADYRIPNEINIPHTYGTLSGAKYYRDNDDNKSEPYEFFIFLGEPKKKRHLDGSYTVFGKVTSGMDVVEKIANEPKDEQEWPLKNVVLTVEVLD